MAIYQINNVNLNNYLTETYGKSFFLSDDKMLVGFPKLLQSHYGKDSDCTLTCITGCIDFKNLYSDTNNNYNEVEKIAKKYFYNGDTYGTIPFFIKPIYRKALKTTGIDYKVSSRYIKGLGFNFDTIKENIDNNNPVILNLKNDGRKYYHDHSVTVIGYRIYNCCTMLMVQDN